MIAAVFAGFAAFQLAAAVPPLVVRDAHHSVRVPLVPSANGPMLRPESLGGMMLVSVHHDSAPSYTVDVSGTRMQLELGVPIVRVGDLVRQLVSAPFLQKGQLMVPLQLVSDVFPLVVPNTRWDADSAQLILFTMDARASAFGSSVASGAIAAGAMPAARAPRQNGGEISRPSQLPPVPVKHFRRTVVVDAGHGGIDNGMSGPLGGGGPRIYEKNITLAVATRLGEQLKARGVDVVYTRTTDTLIALDDRGRIANRAAGDLFVSIHVNAANPNWKDPAGSRGFETYFLSEAKTEDARRVERMENAVVSLENGPSTVDSGDPLRFILSDMTQNEHLRESSELAELIQRRLATMHPGPNRGVKQAGFRVLVTAFMPAVLVEIGFGTNARESAYLSDPQKQDAIAAAVADGAMAYLERYERRVTGAGTGPGGGPAR
jgi:N-acetylmuramoyl-L-alanine amidase